MTSRTCSRLTAYSTPAMKKVRYSVSGSFARVSERVEFTVSSFGRAESDAVQVRHHARPGNGLASATRLAGPLRRLFWTRALFQRKEVGQLAQSVGLGAHLFGGCRQLLGGGGVALRDLVHLRHGAIHLRHARGLFARRCCDFLSEIRRALDARD